MEQEKTQEVNLKTDNKVTKNGGNAANQQSGVPNQQGGGSGGGGDAGGHQRRNQRFRGPGPRGGGHQLGRQQNQLHNQGDRMELERNLRYRIQGSKYEGGPGNHAPGGHRNPEDRIMERLLAVAGPTFDVSPVDMTEKKFAGQNRLYIGNLSADITEGELNDMFKPFGETTETFINKEKNFGFIRLDYHANAKKATHELDGTMYKGRMLKVRFAPNGATIKVKNLTQWVTNELLYVSFSVFGEIERCVIIVDERGKTTGEGIVEFARKQYALSALNHCSDGCFFLTSSLRPVIVESYDQMDVVAGYPEKSLIKKSQEYYQAREIGPRFAKPGSFEHEYGTRWKQLHELYKQKQLSLKQELAMEEEKLEAQMQFAKFENETEMLREQLRVREMDRERQKRELKDRERLVEEQRRRNEEQMRLHQEELQLRIHSQEEDIRRRQQENSLFMQAHQLNKMLDQQEQVIQGYNSPMDNAVDNEEGEQEEQIPGISNERSHRYEGWGMGDGQDMFSRGFVRAHRGNDNRRDDFQGKRRRY